MRRWLVGLGGALLACACGSSSSGSGAADASAGLDANVDAPSGVDADRSDAAMADAGTDADQDPDVYPAKHQPAAQIDNLGGPVIAHPKVVTVTFAGDALKDTLRAFDDALVGSSYWQSTLSEYGVGVGASGGYAELPDTVTGKDTLDQDIQALLSGGIASGTLPAPDASTIYVVHFPPNAAILFNNGQLVSCVDFASYHGTFTAMLDGGASAEIVYAPVARCDTSDPAQSLSLATIATSHALAEATTDPFPDAAPAFRLATNDAWKTTGGSAASDEVGDLCGITRFVDAGPDAAIVQRLWSNAAALGGFVPCAPAPAGSVGFGAAVRTDLVSIGARKSYGYVVVPAGGDATTIVDVFSAAPLASELTLLVGSVKPGDPAHMNPMPGGISATLSRSTAHNGNGVVLTLHAPAGIVSGAYPFAVRALAADQTFFDWPVLALIR